MYVLIFPKKNNSEMLKEYIAKLENIMHADFILTDATTMAARARRR